MVQPDAVFRPRLESAERERLRQRWRRAVKAVTTFYDPTDQQ
jgi:hypothetical protein